MQQKWGDIPSADVDQYQGKTSIDNMLAPAGTDT